MNADNFQQQTSNQGSPEEVSPVLGGDPGVFSELPSILAKGLSLSFHSIHAAVKSRTQQCIKYQFQRGREILRGVSGKVRPGQVLAILGESGGGKSTLLSFLAGFHLQGVLVDGIVQFGNTDMTSNDRKSICGYVPQRDLLLPYLTVKEHLHAQATLRLASHTQKQVLDIVSETLTVFNLKKVEDSLIGHPGQGISGGERKRLSLAAECLAKPSVLVCDEPTSGSDAFTATLLIELLLTLAKKKRKTIIVSIHQPSSALFFSFSRVMIMARGRVAYLGRPRECNRFFETLGYPCPNHFNPSDYYMSILSTKTHQQASSTDSASQQNDVEKVEAICNAFQVHISALEVQHQQQKGNSELHDVILTTFGHKQASIQRQMATLITRYWRRLYRIPSAWLIGMGQGVFFAIILSLTFRKQKMTEDFNKIDVFDVNGILFAFVLANGFQIASKTCTVFIDEFPLFLFEQGHGLYHVWVFFVTKTFFDLAWLVTLPLMTSGPTYFIVGLNLDPWSRMPLTVLYLILLTATNASLGYLFGIVFQRVSVVLPMIAFVNLVLYVAGGGFFANPRALPQMIAWIHKASWFFYTSEGLFANQWADVRFKCFEETNTTSPDCPYPDGNAVLETLGMSPEGRFRNLGVIASILAGMRVAAILLLYMRTRASLQKGS